MAAAEARAAWQRTANRCLVQEDARRAPKLTCYSSSSSKSQSDGPPEGSANVTNHPEPGHMAHASGPNMPDDLKWWLHIQPCLRHEKDFIYEQLHALEPEVDALDAESKNQAQFWYSDQPIEENIDSDFYACQTSMASANCAKNGWHTKIPELKAILNSKTMPKDKEMGEFWCPDHNLMGFESFDDSDHEHQGKMYSDFVDPSLTGAEKSEPWWRTADRDALVSLVAQKSLENVENCDLPRPQIKQFRKGPPSCLGYLDHHGIFASSLAIKANEFSNTASACMNGNQCNISGLGCSLNRPAKPPRNPAETQHFSDTDPDRAQLLEALCHSQTRARKAEKVAQQLQTEKEHIIKLFFKQASQLFAYKQWLRLLQLENLCLQLKNNEHRPISVLFPAMFPWGPKKSARRRRGISWRSVSRSAVVFAVGLSLAGAGLLLGWTMGCLFPIP